MKYFTTLTIGFFLSLMASSCQPEISVDLDATFTPQQLQQDVAYLITNLEQRHIDFYQRAHRDSIEFMRQQVLARLTKPMARTAFFREVGQLNPYFRDAHCLVFPLIEEADQRKEEGQPPFPFHVVLDEQGALRPERSYQRASDGAHIDKAWRILSINGVAAKQILDTIERYSHGETGLLRRHMTTLLFADWLFTLYGWAGTFEVAFEGAAGKVQIEASDSWKNLENNVVQYNRLDILGDGVGYLRLGSFDVDEHEEAYETFVEQAFDSLRKQKVKKLIIDVRGNTGGQSDAGALVLQYLTDRKLSQVSKAYDRIHQGNAGWFSYRGKPGTVKELDLSSDDLIKPIDAEKRFDGKAVVLFDEMTYSAGIIFITIVQDHHLATTIGRPTGGFANQTGNIEAFRLPNTQLLVYAPARKFVRPNGNAAVHPVTPDVVVPTDSTATSDYVLQRALQELQNK
ncbi:MAG: S41 family peptidase [Bacteroidota bacterium]